MQSHVSPDGAVIGADPHYDARQTLSLIANMIDMDNTTRTLVHLKNNTEKLLVDIIKFDGIKVRALPDSNDPMILARVAYYTRDPHDRNPYAKRIAKSMLNTMPKSSIVHKIICASPEEMKILNQTFRANHAKLSTEFQKKLEATLPPKMLLIPESYTTFLAPLYIPKPQKTPKEPCVVCKAPGKYVCSKCKVMRYCSKSCQKKAWKSGHKLKCKSPEDQAAGAASCSDSDAQWIDIDPHKTPAEELLNDIFISIQRSSKKTVQQAFNSGSWPALDGIKKDKMMTLKVQIQLGSQVHHRTPILIYPEKRNFQATCVPENVNSPNGYDKLHSLITSQGTDSGLGRGPCKAFLDGYVTNDGLLRIMINGVKPLQCW